MQVLKEEMRKRIYDSAIREFYDKGFNSASMREIARGAGMTVGNLYRYFEDKEALFYSVISPAYDSLIELVGESIDRGKSQFDSSFFESLSEHILKISKEHKIELLILFEGSAGTRFERAKDELVQVVEDFLKENLTGSLKGKKAEIEDMYLLRVIAVGFVEGMTMIARRYDSDDKLKRVAGQFIAFYFIDMLNRFR